MDSVWSYEKVFPNRYRLVAVDKGMGRGHTLRALWAPGYESRRLSDILQAAWYLNSNGKLRINVDDHQAAILEQSGRKRKTGRVCHTFPLPPEFDRSFVRET